MINCIKYNQERSAYNTFCLLVDFVKTNLPSEVRNKNKFLNGRKELLLIIKKHKNGLCNVC